MSMDAAWKVYVQDRRFDDNQISNCFLKMKYETVGRFTFDFRAIDGDESYMVVGNTLRIFWGDLHKMDGVIQRVDWDDDNWCYKVYGADIRGFLLDRVNTEPATVSSYTSDVTSQVMFTGCDFPTNVWAGAGENIGKYTFHYKIGIQNTVRVLGATQTRWSQCVERGTVYEHQNGCLYDATKNWATNQYAGATLRFVSGACKNNVYNINGNTSNRVCIRLPGESASEYGTSDRYVQNGTLWNYNVLDDSGFDAAIGATGGWIANIGSGWWPHTQVGTVEVVSGGIDGNALHVWGKGYAEDYLDWFRAYQIPNYHGPATISFRYKYSAVTNATDQPLKQINYGEARSMSLGTTNPSYPDWDTFSTATTWMSNEWFFVGLALEGDNEYDLWVDNIRLDVGTNDGQLLGTVPGCSRLGDIYEIVFASMGRIDPSPIIPATLEKDNHIIRYNRVNSLSDHVTSMTIRGT